jgi:UDP-N-acetylmuramyl pentapeptide synthase
MIITQILKKELKGWKIYSSPQNYNSEIGLVFSIFQIEKYEPKIINLLIILFKLLYKLAFDTKPYDVILLEYGIDTKGDMDYLCNIVKPDYSVFTKLDKVHGEFFETVDEIGDEKFKLMQNTKLATFLNDNDDYARTHA